jgi:putative iron-only hydrogenase system regulator
LEEEFFIFRRESSMDKRIGIVGIVIEDFSSVSEVNEILHEYANLIVGRMGLPYKERCGSVISLIMDGTNDEISALTGKLGRIKGVSVKSMITKDTKNN